MLYHAAKKATLARGGVMIPNALKLEETVAETAKEVPRKGNYDYVLIPASSGTIAAGVIKGFSDSGRRPVYLIHLGYSRSEGEVRRYLTEMSGYHLGDRVRVIDEGYAYKDPARPGETPPWPSNSFYDLKAFRWWRKFGHLYLGKTLFWNVG